MLHFRASTGKIEVLRPAGIGLGIGRNGIFEKTLAEIEQPLDAGDILIFYTDGLTEAMNERSELYGLDRLSAILLREKESAANDIKKAIVLDLQTFLGQRHPQDDVTMVLLKMA